MRTRIHLIRHAESAMNRHHRTLVGGRSNHTPLTPAGEAAAEHLGRRLAHQVRPDAIAHTSAVRSVQTARRITRGAGWSAPLILEDGLLELSQGIAEGQPREQWWTPEAIAAMQADPTTHILAPGGESHQQVQARVREALLRLAHTYPGGEVLAVGHGIAMRSLAWSLRGGPHHVFREIELPNLGEMTLLVDLEQATLTEQTSPRRHSPTAVG